MSLVAGKGPNVAPAAAQPNSLFCGGAHGPFPSGVSQMYPPYYAQPPSTQSYSHSPYPPGGHPMPPGHPSGFRMPQPPAPMPSGNPHGFRMGHPDMYRDHRIQPLHRPPPGYGSREPEYMHDRSMYDNRRPTY